jgi:predicted transcriptional regulator
MGKTKPSRPTNSELDILRVLWARGSSTVRDVHGALNTERPIGYTTVLKLMQIMTEKGLVVRDEKERAHVYRAAVAEGQTQRQLVGHLLERAFGGSATKLMMQALASQKASPEEITQMREMLKQFEREAKR